LVLTIDIDSFSDSDPIARVLISSTSVILSSRRIRESKIEIRWSSREPLYECGEDKKYCDACPGQPEREGENKEVIAGKRSYIIGIFVPFFVKRAKDRRSTEDTPVSAQSPWRQLKARYMRPLCPDAAVIQRHLFHHAKVSVGRPIISHIYAQIDASRLLLRAEDTSPNWAVPCCVALSLLLPSLLPS
jgi:hypothetical protein